jgi:hypothetical protein
MQFAGEQLIRKFRPCPKSRIDVVSNQSGQSVTVIVHCARRTPAFLGSMAFYEIPQEPCNSFIGFAVLTQCPNPSCSRNPNGILSCFRIAGPWFPTKVTLYSLNLKLKPLELVYLGL